MPLFNLLMARGQFVVTGEKEIIQHAAEVKIHEARLLAEQELVVRQHFLKREQSLFQLFQPILLLVAPLV